MATTGEGDASGGSVATTGGGDDGKGEGDDGAAGSLHCVVYACRVVYETMILSVKKWAHARTRLQHRAAGRGQRRPGHLVRELCSHLRYSAHRSGIRPALADGDGGRDAASERGNARRGGFVTPWTVRFPPARPAPGRRFRLCALVSRCLSSRVTIAGTV